MTLSDYIKKLKNKTTARHASFSETFDYFLTHIGENTAFEKHFKPCYEHEILEPILIHIGRSLYGDRIKIDEMILLHFLEENFLHGTVRFSNKYFVGLYFFEDILSGIACNIFAGGKKGHTDYYRLNLIVSSNVSPDSILISEAPTTLQ